MTRLKVIQHNVLAWDGRKYDLNNTYRQFDPDIILVNSHGLTHDKRLKIPGYRIIQRNSTNEPNDGVAIAFRNSLMYTRLEDDFISETLAIDMETEDGPLTIATSYLPPRRPFLPHPDFLRLFRRHSPVFFAGDLNARHPTLGYSTTNSVGRDLDNLLQLQTVKHIGPFFPTFFGPVSSSSPDIVLINPFNPFAHSIRPGPLTSSDHLPMIIDICSSPILVPISPTFSFHSANWDNFKEDGQLDMTSQHDISHARLEEIDSALDDWMQTVRTVADKHIPKTSYRTIPCPRPSRRTQLTRIQFQALRDNARTTGWTYDNYRRYRQLRQSLTDSRREEATTCWAQSVARLASSHKHPKKFWKDVKRLSGRSTGPNSTFLTDSNGQRHYSAEEKVRLLTDRWEPVFQNDDEDYEDNDSVLDYLRQNIDRTTPHDRADPARLSGATALDCLISSEELRSAIKSSKATCPGRSSINKLILSHLPDPALGRLRDIFNAALSAGYFPDGFKGAEMRMIVKPGKDPSHPDSYRPISLLETPGKMLERVVTKRLRDHLEGAGVYSPGQYGFRRGVGTAHAIAVVTETLAIQKASGSRCNLVLRDVSKAFDKVWHLGLKFKILHLGLPGPIERLLCDFLEDRTARVKIGSCAGPPFPLSTGVPQGSVLSPTLYTIYTCDCPSSLAGINVQYADDVTQLVFHPGRSSRMLNSRTGREIARVNAFEEEWRIRTNLNKFAVVPLATRNPAPLLVNEDPVDFSPRGRLLGLQISGRGYTSHVTNRVKQARRTLGALYRFRDLDRGLKLHLIKTLVIPVLTYPPVPIHALSRSVISRLQRVQNAALKFALNLRWDDFTTAEAMHEVASIPALNVRLHNLASGVWKRLKDMGWEQFNALLELHQEAPNHQHAWFPRSLLTIEHDPAPPPCYQ